MNAIDAVLLVLALAGSLLVRMLVLMGVRKK